MRSGRRQLKVLVCPLWGQVAPVVPVGGLLWVGGRRTGAVHNSAQSQVGAAGTGRVGGPTVFLGTSSFRPPGGRALHRNGMRGRKAPGGHSTSRGWWRGQLWWGIWWDCHGRFWWNAQLCRSGGEGVHVENPCPHQGMPLRTPQRVQHRQSIGAPGLVGASSKQGTSGRQPEIPPQGV